jgi:hypothetical protein
MEDLKQFYVRSLEDRQRNVEASAGDAALAQFEPPSEQPAPAVGAAVSINADPNAPQDLSKVPGYKPTWTPPAKRQLQTPSPEEARRMMGRPSRPRVPGEDLQAEDQQPTMEEQIDAALRQMNRDRGLDPETGMTPAARTMMEYLANTDDVGELHRKMTSPEGIGLLDMMGILGPPITPAATGAMMVTNVVMHAARKALDAGGVPEPYRTIGEFAAGVLVNLMEPETLANHLVGNIPGSAYRPPRAA